MPPYFEKKRIGPYPYISIFLQLPIKSPIIKVSKIAGFGFSVDAGTFSPCAILQKMNKMVNFIGFILSLFAENYWSFGKNKYQLLTSNLIQRWFLTQLFDPEQDSILFYA